MRETLALKTSDNRLIYGTLDSGNNKTVLIFVHGFTGNQDEHHYFNAVPFFIKNNCDTFRFNFYSRDVKARHLTESSITTHTQDLKVVIDNFKDKYDELILIGHSLGALVILNTDVSDVSRLVLWDPTTPFKNIEEKGATFDPILNKYIFHWGIDFLVPMQMLDEWISLDLNKLIEKVPIPCKLIFAGDSGKHELWKPYINRFRIKHESVIIARATHGFIEEGTEQELFEETLTWIK